MGKAVELYWAGFLATIMISLFRPPFVPLELSMPMHLCTLSKPTLGRPR